MKLPLAVLLLFVLLLPLSLADWFYTSEEVQVEITISGGADVVKQKSDGVIQSAMVNLSLFPKQFAFQQIVSEDIGPTPDKEGQSVVFRYENPSDRISYLLRSNVIKKNSFVPVQDKIEFPIKNIPDDLQVYLQPTEIINADNPAIIKLASQLVDGEDDLYGAVFSIAKWTKENIKYNLSTLTADASQQASWVLEHKKGVCDELTSLFIAMLRSVGIPAKFVTGHAYTNSPLFVENWGLHGWSEVYFPGVGWAPFDVTYGQYGFVDPTHIKLKESHDAQDSATKYQWVGRDVTLQLGNLETAVDLIGYTGKIPPLLNLEGKMVKTEIGFNSFNAIELLVTNPNNYYLATELRLGLPQEVTVIGDQAQNILLKPGQTQKVYWVLRIGDSFEENFIYTFPAMVSSSRNQSTVFEFTSSASSPVFTMPEIGAIIDQRIEREEKEYSTNVNIDCEYSAFYYEADDASVSCDVTNTGNRFLEDVDVCLGEQCTSVDIGISQSATVQFELPLSKKGSVEQQVTVSNAQVSQAATLTYEARDQPIVALTDFVMPTSVSYNEEYSISFLIDKVSVSNPEQIAIELSDGSGTSRWTLSSITQDRPFTINTKSNRLKPGHNELNVKITYHDGHGKMFLATYPLSVELTGLTMGQKVESYATYYLNSLSEMDPSTLVLFLAVAIGAFILVLLMVFAFRRRSE